MIMVVFRHVTFVTIISTVVILSKKMIPIKTRMYFVTHDNILLQDTDNKKRLKLKKSDIFENAHEWRRCMSYTYEPHFWKIQKHSKMLKHIQKYFPCVFITYCS